MLAQGQYPKTLVCKGADPDYPGEDCNSEQLCMFIARDRSVVVFGCGHCGQGFKATFTPFPSVDRAQQGITPTLSDLFDAGVDVLKELDADDGEDVEIYCTYRLPNEFYGRGGQDDDERFLLRIGLRRRRSLVSMRQSAVWRFGSCSHPERRP